jgi:glycosyltransferase involved in cell wall biosynthesis
MRISFIVPAHNEAANIREAVVGLQSFLRTMPQHECEIVVVNDGSSDDTGNILKEIGGIEVVTHAYAKGYGAALKSGIRKSSHEWVFLFDGDGQARPQEIPKLLAFGGDYDMVVGDRVVKKAPLIRAPGRAILLFLANYLSDRKIPDLNCGFRLIKKDKIERFKHLLPDSFSFTTTITLAFQKSGLDIKYVPIEVNKRTGGKSTVKPVHAIRMFFLILRTITMFSPLRIFMPIVLFLGTLLSLSLAYDFYHVHITNTTVVLFVSALIIFLFGLLADQMAAIRREIQR